MKISGNPTQTDKIVYRLRMMAESGGMLSRDRIRTLIEAADRLDLYAERINIMDELKPLTDSALTFPPGGDGE